MKGFYSVLRSITLPLMKRAAPLHCKTPEQLERAIEKGHLGTLKFLKPGLGFRVFRV